MENESETMLKKLLVASRQFQREQYKSRLLEIEKRCPNGTQKSKVIRSNLSNDAGEFVWDILSALRGPDTNIESSDRLKELTTGRIRSFVIGYVPGRGISIRTESLSAEEITERNSLLEESKKQFGSHFANHFEWALKALQNLGFKVPTEEFDFGLREG
jgi:hypothetical protein